jgi:hypothetical protein
MQIDDSVKIDGESSKPWKLWRVDNAGTPITLVAEADTREELTYKHRQDWRYKIFHNKNRSIEGLMDTTRPCAPLCL